ncbi:DEAD domain-containing protein/Helicase_C domain-containing protein [Cephalotus follicularis]|uniref:RNA helicase n=1 Tax=Cephalotus follicularis TaxID=3775 RepID=A0A1Q3CS55_CEPFO|nr:DEAD domain-containing protein/Helicase_C domain-containing protein [Cephalotus follicularis]
MSKRKFGFDGFTINRQQTYNFDRSQPPQRLYVPPSSRHGHDNYEDNDLDDIDYAVDNDTSKADIPDNDEIDPLDAFMEGIHEEMRAAPEPKPKEKAERYRDDEEDDPMESFMRSKKDIGLTLAADALRAGYDSDEEVYAAAKAVDSGLLDYDSDDNPLVVDKKKIEPISALDHSSIDYEPFNKDFYEESPSISGMSEQDAMVYRKSLAVRVSGFDVPRPIKTFEDCGFSSQLMGAIAKQGYEKPTAIQCQALPIVLSGSDIIGIAKTGSGKTAAFVLPMIVHIMDQPELEKEEGPIGVICAPTRELAHQIYLEAKKFAKSHGIRVSAVYGGMSKLDQFKELKAGSEIVVATPGRLIDMLKMKALTMTRATYLVLDEADRMFDLGFEPQIRSIVGQIRPDRQTLLFSATMPRKVEKLAREILSDPVRVTVGEVGMANEDITQVVHVIPSDVEKLPWLIEKLPGMIDEGDVLVFASKKATVDEIESQLAQNGFKVAALHGDKDQASRMEILDKYKSGIYHVLIATDVAARGLDIKSIKSVVNFDIAKDMDMHVHRIGRTGRAGDKDGTAYTLITQKEARFAGELVNSLIAAGQNVSIELMDLAMKDGRFRSKRDARKGGGKKSKGRGGGGGGRGVRGVDFGLGIGYSEESNNASSQTTPSQSSASNSLRSRMSAQFRSKFVAASTNSQSQDFNDSSTASPNKRPILPGFVSGGSIGGDISRTQTTSSFSPASSNSQSQGSSNISSAYPNNRPTLAGFASGGSIGGDINRSQTTSSFSPASQNSRENNSQKSSESSRDRARQRRRPSGWDR